MIISGPDEIFTLNEPREKLIKAFIKNIQKDLEEFGGDSVKKAIIGRRKIAFTVVIENHLYLSYKRLLEDEERDIIRMRVKHACIKAGWKNAEFAENTTTKPGGLNIILIAP